MVYHSILICFSNNLNQFLVLLNFSCFILLPGCVLEVQYALVSNGSTLLTIYFLTLRVTKVHLFLAVAMQDCVLMLDNAVEMLAWNQKRTSPTVYQLFDCININ